MAQRQTIDWDSFIEQSRRHRADSCAYWTLSLARMLAGAEIPERVLQQVAPPMGSIKKRFLARHFVYHLLPIESDWPSQKLRRALWEAAIQPGRYGHGPLRPWQLDDRNPEPATARSRESRLASGISRLGVWARYVRAIS
jgi:hypothetical protein